MLAYPSLISTSYRNALMNSYGLTGYWRLGQAAGTVVIDELGKNPGTYAGSPTLGAGGLISGAPNTGMTVTGTTGVYAYAPSADPGSTFSKSIWIKLNSLSGSNAYIMKGRGNGSGIILKTDGTGQIFFQADGVGTIATTTTGLFTTGIVYNMVITKKGTGATGKIYLNGKDVTASPASVEPNASTEVLFVAQNSPEIPDATVDEPACWNRALTLNEVNQFYRIGRGF